MRIPFLGLLIVFVGWLTVKIKMSDKENRNSKEAFLEKEIQANLTRKQSLDDLDYITIPLDRLPFYDEIDNEIITYQNKIINLSKKKIVNLTGTTNTDLKLKYGAANFNDLSEFDKNFTELARTLYTWGKKLNELQKNDDAKTVLEYAISIKTDISDCYIILANIYISSNETSSIYNLIDSAGKLDSLMKNTIIKKLNDILSQSGRID